MHGRSLDDVIARHAAHLPANDNSLAKALCYGVLRHYFTLCGDIDALLQKPLRNKDKDIYALMLVGAYQLQAMRMPPYAALDSVVKASKELNKPWAGGLINAVLRKWQKLPAAQHDAQTQSEHPLWLYKLIKQAWPEQANGIFTANNSAPPLCLRVNLMRVSRAAYQQKLAEAGINAVPGTFSDAALYLPEKPANITELPGFSDGECSVQDEAAQLAADLLAAQPGMRILDACAAPGGKTCHILEQLQNRAELLAVDIDNSRLDRVQQNLDRLQLNARLQAADIADTDNWWDGQHFDRILCDVPCSATGVIRRHPDIKLLRTEADIVRLSALQVQILEHLWHCLKPGGVLLYATCSILPQENSDVVARFCEKTTDCEAIAIAQNCGIVTGQGRQLFPQPAAHDGFFYARLEKRDNP